MSDEFDNTGNSLDDVCDRLDNIEAAVTANHQEFSWLGFIILGWLALAGLTDMWNSKFRYSLWYSTPYDQVTIQKKPADCNFFHAPLGGKSCQYESKVNIVKVDNSNTWGGQSISYDNGETWIHTAKNQLGLPIVSKDGGKTWSTDSVPVHTAPQLIVSWEKKDDD